MLRPVFFLFACAAAFLSQAKQINSIVDLAHGFSFYGDGRFSTQYTPNQPWARNLASFKVLDLPNANANLLVLFEPDRQAPFTKEDRAIVKEFVKAGGLVVALADARNSGLAALLSDFGLTPAGAGKGKPQAEVAWGMAQSRGAPGIFRIAKGLEHSVYVKDEAGNPVVVAVKQGEGFLIAIPRNMVSQDPGSRDKDFNADWIRPMIEKHIVKEVPKGSRPKGRDFAQQDFRESVNGVTFHYNAYLAPYYAAMKEIVQTTTPLIEKRMGVPLAGSNASEVALLATGGGGFSSGRLIALAVFWEDFPKKREGMVEFLTHESIHSWVLPFPEVWNEPIATYVGDLVMMDAGYPEEGVRRIRDTIRRATRLDPGMAAYDLGGKSAVPGKSDLKAGDANDMHWGKTFWIFEELRKENPTILADYFQAKRRLADPAKIKRYGINETVAVMSHAMKRDMFGWFAERGIKANREASAIASFNAEVSEETAIRDALLANLKATETEDIDAVMATMSETLSKEQRAATLQVHKQIFEAFDCSYELESFEVIKLEGDHADVRMKQVTRKRAGELPFQDNRLTAIHKLVKEKGQWRFFDMKIENVEFLY